MHFSVPGIDAFPAIPLLVAFLVSFFTSMGGFLGNVLWGEAAKVLSGQSNKAGAWRRHPVFFH
jgi:hypothetical protein